MGHQVIRCDKCAALVMEAPSGVWDCDCGHVYNSRRPVVSKCHFVKSLTGVYTACFGSLTCMATPSGSEYTVKILDNGRVIHTSTVIDIDDAARAFSAYIPVRGNASTLDLMGGGYEPD